MIKPVVIVGAGRFGRGIADILDSIDAVVAGYLDDTKPNGESLSGHVVLGEFSAMRDRSFVDDYRWVVAIGDNHIRTELCRNLADAGACFVNVVHPSAQISPRATLGRGIYVGASAVISTDSAVSDWVIVGIHAYLGIDVSVGAGAYIGHGSILAGGTSVGDRSFLGSGTIISNDASVGADCIVGAGSVVLRHLPDGATAYGAPAQPAPLRQHPFRR